MSTCQLNSIVLKSKSLGKDAEEYFGNFLAKAPKTIKLYVNRVHLDFENVEDVPPVQTLILNKEYFLSDGKEIELERMKWENVDSIALFVVDNLENEETTRIDYFQLIGKPLKFTRPQGNWY